MSELDEVLSALPLPALIVGPDERIHTTNPAAVQLIGGGLGGRHYVTALRQPAILDAIEAVMRDGTRRETQYVSVQGLRDIRWKVTLAAVPAGILATFEDTTPLEEAGQIRRDFVANVSHELRTPLTALQGFIETLRGAARDDAVARDRFLVIMEREADRMNRLIRDLLSLSRVEADERLRPREAVDLAEVLRRVASTLAPLASERGAEIVLKFPDEVGSAAPAEATLIVTGDADQLAQVFTNLIENAVKYAGGRVGVTVSRQTAPGAAPGGAPGSALCVDVADDGDGIDPMHLPRLTERFYRVDTHRSREMGGTGLGLAIVKHIIGRHRGRLRIHSEVGIGSRFSVVLPLP